MCSGRRSATLPRQRGAVSARAQGLAQVWHARGTVQCAVEVDPLREERATGVLDGCLFARRLRWHAVRAAAGLNKVGVHPVDGVHTARAGGLRVRGGGGGIQRMRWDRKENSTDKPWTTRTGRLAAHTTTRLQTPPAPTAPLSLIPPALDRHAHYLPPPPPPPPPTATRS